MMSDSDPSDFDSMGKRRFLNTLAGFGVSATTLNYITKEAAAKHTENLNKEIPYVKALRTNESGDREPIYGSIPNDKYIKTEAIESASQALYNKIDNKIDTKNISIRVRKNNNDEFILVVDYKVFERLIDIDGELQRSSTTPNTSIQELEQIVPSTMTSTVESDRYKGELENIPVTVVETRNSEDIYFDEKYRPVPGGCQFGHGSTSYGTTGCRARQWSGDENDVILASAHGLKKAREDDADIPQPAGGTIIADDLSVKYWRGQSTDFGYFVPSSTDATDKLAETGGGYKSEDISGVVTWSWIKNNINQAKIYKQGAKTGVTSGYLTDFVNDKGQKAFWGLLGRVKLEDEADEF